LRDGWREAAHSNPHELADADSPELLEQFDARQILHVTFGSSLTERAADGQRLFFDRFMNLLWANAEAYAADLEAHSGKRHRARIFHHQSESAPPHQSGQRRAYPVRQSHLTQKGFLQSAVHRNNLAGRLPQALGEQ